MIADIKSEIKTAATVKQAAPFFGVTNREASLRYYIDGLGFEMTHKWIVDGECAGAGCGREERR